MRFHRFSRGVTTDTDDAPAAENYLDNQDACDDSAGPPSTPMHLTIPQDVVCGSKQRRWLEGQANYHVPTSPLAVEV